MVYVDPDELKWLPFVKTWLDKWGKNMSPEAPAYLLKLFETYVEDGLRFVSKKCTQTMNQVSVLILCDHSLKILSPLLVHITENNNLLKLHLSHI